MVFKRILYFIKSDRIGPDIPLTHIMLHFKWSMNFLCKRKFKSFGEDAEVRPYSYFSGCSKIIIGSRTTIRPGSFLYADVQSLFGGNIIIEEDVLLGNNCNVYASNHVFSDKSLPISKQGHTHNNDVIVRKGAWVGANVVILPGVTIGKNSVVGAGSIVTKDVPDFTVAVGNPAKVIKKI